jgi:MFS family permease
MIASPLAGSILEPVRAERIAALGGVVGGAGLALIGSSHPGTTGQTIAIAAALMVQGFGVGLFQVAYMDVVMRTLPREHRGVAGSIAMLTRSLGTVAGATLLTLLFHAVESVSAGGFLQAFRATFWTAGAVSALAGLLVLLSHRRRG